MIDKGIKRYHSIHGLLFDPKDTSCNGRERDFHLFSLSLLELPYYLDCSEWSQSFLEESLGKHSLLGKKELLKYCPLLFC